MSATPVVVVGGAEAALAALRKFLAARGYAFCDRRFRRGDEERGPFDSEHLATVEALCDALRGNEAAVQMLIDWLETSLNPDERPLETIKIAIGARMSIVGGYCLHLYCDGSKLASTPAIVVADEVEEA